MHGTTTAPTLADTNYSLRRRSQIEQCNIKLSCQTQKQAQTNATSSILKPSYERDYFRVTCTTQANPEDLPNPVLQAKTAQITVKVCPGTSCNHKLPIWCSSRAYSFPSDWQQCILYTLCRRPVMDDGHSQFLRTFILHRMKQNLYENTFSSFLLLLRKSQQEQSPVLSA